MPSPPPSREALFEQPATILLIDDSPQDRELIERELRRHFKLVTCKHVGDPAELDRALAGNPPDLAITDYRLQWSDGLAVLRLLKRRTPQTPVIMFTGSGSEEVAVAAMKEGADDYVTKLQRNYARLPYSVAVGLERSWHRRQLDQTLTALREGEARFRSVAEAMPEMVCTLTPAGHATYVNERFRTYVGVSLEESRELAKFAHPDELESLVDAWQHAVASVQQLEVECRWRAKDGSYRWFLSRAVPLTNEQGEITEWVATITDIHDQKRAAEALRDADRRKDEFIATLAHELRNPLAPIRSALQFLQLTTRADAETQHACDIIERQLVHMIHLVDDLLEVSRINTGKINLRKQPANVYQLVLAAVESAKPLIEASAHTLTISSPPEPVTADVDPTRLTQVFGNILSNAAKYTAVGGRIDIHVTREGDWIVTSIRDTGYGVPQEMLGRIFDLFAQVHPDHADQGGLGIGLALSKRLVELHGGTIAAYSEGEGRGTEVVVRLPSLALEIQSVETTTVPESHSEPAMRKVLVVDDNRDAADSLAMLLEVAECDVRKCYDGDTGLALARDFKPELMLLDVGMPAPDGFEVCRRLRQEPWGRNIIVSALTGWGQDEDRRRTSEAGFDEHLVKPVDMDVILQLLARHGGAGAGEAGVRD